MIRLKKVAINVLSAAVIILTLPVWATKIYLSLGNKVYEGLKHGAFGKIDE
jgi:hypothetical protein